MQRFRDTSRWESRGLTGTAASIRHRHRRYVAAVGNVGYLNLVGEYVDGIRFMAKTVALINEVGSRAVIDVPALTSSQSDTSRRDRVHILNGR